MLRTLAVCLISVGLLSAADWPHWRGPARNDTTSESSGYRDGTWIASRPTWQASVGEGSTSPLVVAGKVFVLGHEGKQDRLHCLDAASGKSLWQASYPAPRYGRFHRGDEVFYGGPSSTPEYDHQTRSLYTLSNDGDLNCWDTARKGARVWGFNLYDRYGARARPKVGRGGQQRDYGYTTSPLVVGEVVLVEVGGKKGNLMAFDRRTGKDRWASECKDRAGHTAGPALMTVGGVPCAVVLTLERVVVIRLDRGHEGRTVASHPWATEFANNIASPAVAGDRVLVTSAYNRNAIACFRVTLEGMKRLWEKPYPSKACSPVVSGKHVYIAWQKVRCLDLETGALRWEGGSIGDPGSILVTADDRLVVWGHNGRLLLVEGAGRSPRAYRELARQDRIFSSHAWPHVALSGGRLFVKDRRGNLKCFAVSAPR